jgi:gluconolactonase
MCKFINAKPKGSSFSPSNKFIFAVLSSLLISFTSNANIIQRDAVAKVNSIYCPADSESIPLELSNVSLVREKNIPLMYVGTNNIEGPLWYQGALYYTNMGSLPADNNGFELTNQSTIWRWVPGNKPQVWLDDKRAGTNGLAIDNQGNLVVARQLDGSLSYIDWQSQKVSPIVTSYEGKRFNSPNDLTIAFDDTIYFTDPNWNTPSNVNPADVQGGGEPGSQAPGQRIYRVTADGQVTATQVTDLVPALGDKPNGIILSLDQQHLIVGGLAGLWVFELKSGEVSAPKQILNTPIDGLGKDCSGNIYVTTTRELPERNDGQVVVILNNNYHEIGVLNVPDIHIVTNIAFGGDEGRTLFVTGLTATMDGEKVRQCGQAACMPAGIYTAKLNVQGFPF